ncbi:MAG TPA: hypothetical protein VG077_14245 [Verrucomicrobiae bacterium]|nr:hypothetical protein [Verrucomicrobiae bacterium]
MKPDQGAEKRVVQAAANVCIETCQKLAAQIERAKGNLLTELRGTLEVPEKLFRLALGEAEALAWQTGYPQLVFPALAAEKVQAAVAWNTRQQFLFRKKSIHALSI